MKSYKVMTLIVALVAALSVTAAPIASAAQDGGFTGAWSSVDLDGSHQQLLIRNSVGGYGLVWFDDGASICGKDANGKPIYPAIGTGQGNADNYILQMNVRFWCLSHPPAYWGMVGVDFTYDPVTDTLWDGWVRWHRIGDK